MCCSRSDRARSRPRRADAIQAAAKQGEFASAWAAIAGKSGRNLPLPIARRRRASMP
ncbi:MAG: hypothetical protein OJF62_003099 [Pseudolabrys sp.]|nr:hypothetical protein [Pseudolabrys sp.]